MVELEATAHAGLVNCGTGPSPWAVFRDLRTRVAESTRRDPDNFG